MPKLKEQEPKTIYWFTNKSNRKMKKYSGDLITEGEVKEFEIPDYLIESPPKNKDKNSG